VSRRIQTGGLSVYGRFWKELDLAGGRRKSGLWGSHAFLSFPRSEIRVSGRKYENSERKSNGVSI
jgi:hypothetical protein